jgi:hypothetical protein
VWIVRVRYQLEAFVPTLCMMRRRCSGVRVSMAGIASRTKSPL